MLALAAPEIDVPLKTSSHNRPFQNPDRTYTKLNSAQHTHPLAMLKSLISFGKQGIKSYDNQPHQHSQLGSRMFLPQSWTNNFLQILAQRKTYCLPIELDHLDGTDAKISHHLPIHAVPLQCRMHPPDWSLQ